MHALAEYAIYELDRSPARLRDYVLTVVVGFRSIECCGGVR